jgi:hypothetical protein
MGEIAEMMLDGTLCEGCGAYIDDEGGDGIPRYCSPQCARDRGATWAAPRWVSARAQAERDGDGRYIGPTAYKPTKAWRRKLEAFGEVRAHDFYHWQVRKGARVLADWWPHKGKFRVSGAIQHGREADLIRALTKAGL